MTSLLWFYTIHIFLETCYTNSELIIKGDYFMKHDSLKQQIIHEIDHRIALLEEHQDDEIIITGNQYEELNQALKKVINVPLHKELDSLRSYIDHLS